MRKYVLNIAVVTIAFFAAVPLVKASDQTDVRSTVQHVFEQLKSQNYSALYDLLPGASRNRMSRASGPRINSARRNRSPAGS